MSREDLQREVFSRLTPEESAAYQAYMNAGSAPLSLETSLKLFELFVQGKTCREIGRIHPGFTLGMIVRARVEHLWDERRDAYVAELYDHTKERLRQTALESVNFIADMMAAAHKLHGEKFRRYLATGDPRELPREFSIDTIKEYKTIIETLMKVSGADSPKQAAPAPHDIPLNAVTANVIDVSSAKASPQEASKALAELEKALAKRS